MFLKDVWKKTKNYVMAAVFTTVLAIPVLASGETVVNAGEVPQPILLYDFENESGSKSVTDKIGENHPTTSGGVRIRSVDAWGSKALYFVGNNGYLEFPQGFFANRDVMTISMDICSMRDYENFFTFAIGNNETEYLYLRTRATDIAAAITHQSYGAEQAVTKTGQFKNVWMNVTLVINEDNLRLYINGECVDEEENLNTYISDFGEDVIGYIGKSFYGADTYFMGYIDNVMVYDTALTSLQIAELNGVDTAPFRDVKSADNSLIMWEADKETKTLHLYTSKSAGANSESVVISFVPQENSELLGGNALTVVYGKETELEFVVRKGDTTVSEFWTVTATVCGNPVLRGQFADPDIDVFGDTYYLYTTTDGYAGWSATQFHVFSSKNLVDWTDEGVILDVAAGKDVPWSVGSAWAPTIEEKNGKYYFYFCAKRPDGASCIGVAVADHPAGPYTAMPEPLMTSEICAEYGISMQCIDPSIYTEGEDSYMLFGNGSPAVVKLNADMVSCDLSTMTGYKGANGFREAITVVKRDGVYHFTWSCDDTGSPNYHVNYGTSDSIYGPIQYKYTVLEKNEDLDILGTGHHSMLQIPGEDEYYIAYHRFFMPLGFFTDGTGHHRQTCIDKVTFGADGLMQVITPTLEGVQERIIVADVPEVTPTPEATPTPETTKAPEETTPTPVPTTTTPDNNTGLIIAIVAVVAVIAVVAVVVIRKKK